MDKYITTEGSKLHICPFSTVCGCEWKLYTVANNKIKCRKNTN